ncbi:IS5 family transposase [Candidatus Accumulibacter vicinus]|uniref:Transposase n=1 Tax=Candidatus Accumulibacter vicinus TaxID=2954382 RepID=A0A084XW90_9PROT|nr:IS5 family transposase [Candidatus Accumulibacter vicinus]KFB66734.1 MAG: Transposase [Candidatus Accumulibacter vicinus]
MNRRHELRDDPWERIKDLLPGRAGHVGVTAADNRLFVEAVLYRYRTGIPWRDRPQRFGDFRVVHIRFSRWSQSGVWKRVFRGWAEEADNEWVMMDASLVRAHPHRAGALKKGPEVDQAIGRSRGGLSTKIHATVDALGNPTGFHLTPGQTHDLVGADVLLADSSADAVLADKADDAQKRLVEPLEKAGKQIVIPSRSTHLIQRPLDRHRYRARHLIENFFAKLKQFRAIATRYDKTARNFLGAIHLAASLVWLN